MFTKISIAVVYVWFSQPGFGPGLLTWMINTQSQNSLNIQAANVSNMARRCSILSFILKTDLVSKNRYGNSSIVCYDRKFIDD